MENSRREYLTGYSHSNSGLLNTDHNDECASAIGKLNAVSSGWHWKFPSSGQEAKQAWIGNT